MSGEQSSSLPAEALPALSSHAADVLGQPMMAVATQSSSDFGSHVTVMDGAGRCGLVVVVSALDSGTLVKAMAEAAIVTRRAWREVAASYPAGLAAFRRDWSSFRDSLPAGLPPIPRLSVITGAVDEDAEHASWLAEPAGVLVCRVRVRRLSPDVALAEVGGRGAREVVLPWASTRGEATRTASGPSGPDGSLPEVDDRPPPRRTRRSLRTASGGPRSASPSGQGASEPVSTVELAVQQRAAKAERNGGLVPHVPGDVRAAARARERPAPPPAALVQVAQMLAQSAIVVAVRDEHVHATARLKREGVLVLGDGRAFTDVVDASRAALGVDGADGADGVSDDEAWELWRFGIDGPSLAEAREEAARLSRPSRRAARTRGPAVATHRRDAPIDR